MHKFKIEWWRRVYIHTHRYSKSINEAMQLATEKPLSKPDDPAHESTPDRAHVYQMVDGIGWELVAIVNASGVKPVSPYDRPSVLYAKRRIVELEAEIEKANFLCGYIGVKQ